MILTINIVLITDVLSKWLAVLFLVTPLAPLAVSTIRIFCQEVT